MMLYSRALGLAKRLISPDRSVADEEQPVSRGVRWRELPSQRPWFDRPDALQSIDRIVAARRLDEQQREWLKKWVRDGYFIVENAVDPDPITRFSQRIEDVWFRSEPLPGLRINDVRVGDTFQTYYAHDKLLKLPVEVRKKAMADSNWRIAGFHDYDDLAAAIFHSKRLQDICSAVFDQPAFPQASITFTKGSQQALHQDTCVFHVYPRNFLIGVWIACEDISPDSGPLVFYPGSHREPMFPEFDNYPQTQRRTASGPQGERYDSWVNEMATKYERATFTPKIGSALFWHGMLIHGGSPVNSPALTRKSFVTHYMTEAADKAPEMVGPFQW